MSTSSSQSEVMYEVVVSEEGQFSIWPMNKALPSGWTKAASQAGTKETCLEFIRGTWTDMRPLSLYAQPRSLPTS
ncbi:MbtH family NRPS accessory protein [Dyella sp. S184]|jgi:MbtH protein|uniref:MbtH family protein n=1 Tax=Dyella sp. S184 TaxID=1641862 RepID=UPI00131BA814|nr:MbtH family NRPS accessory protein [Dyella sp. S184]